MRTSNSDRMSGKRNIVAIIVAAAIIAGFPDPSWANTECAGTISFLAADNAGNVYVDLGYGIWEVCNVSQEITANGLTVTTDSCKAWYAALLAAEQAGTSATLYFYSSASCASYGSWVSPSPYFVQPQ